MFDFLETRRPWLPTVVIAFLTFAFHLAFGVWFWTMSPTGASKLSLRTSGDAYLTSFPTWDTKHEADGAFYNRGAVEMLRTGIPRTRSGMFFEHAPLYACFLAGSYKLGGLRLLALDVPQAALSALTCLFVGLTAIRMVPRRPALAGALASAWILINVHLAGFTGYPSPTTLLLFCFALGMWAFVTSPEGGIRPLFILAMVLGVYTQAAFFVIGFGVVLWLLVAYWKSRALSLLVGAIVLAGGVLAKPMISIAIDRSKETHSTEVPTTALWEANNPYYESMTIFSLWERRPGNTWSHWKPSARETERYEGYLRRAGGNGTKAALLWIRENPASYFELCLVRLRAVLGPITGQMSPKNRWICGFLWVLIFPAGFLGLWKLRATRLVGIALFIMVFEVSFECLILASWQPRYRLPIDLMLCVAACSVYAEQLGRLLPGARTVSAATN